MEEARKKECDYENDDNFEGAKSEARDGEESGESDSGQEVRNCHVDVKGVVVVIEDGIGWSTVVEFAIYLKDVANIRVKS
jgi:hypothetical protein